MDAISFVLGVQSVQLRGKELRDLVHRFDKGTPHKIKCYVKLYYVDEENKQIIFKREIKNISATTPTSTYHVNEETVSWEDYQKELHKINIFPKYRNFLVFQGNVEEVAQMSGKHITDIIERVSRSGELKQKYEELQQKEREAKESTMFTYQKKRGITAEKKQFKEQKVEAEKYNELSSKLRRLLMKKVLIQLFYIQKELDEYSEKTKSKTDKIKEIEEKQVSLLATLKKDKKVQAKHHQEFLKLQKQYKDKLKESETDKPALIKIKEEIQFSEKKIRDGENEIKRLEISMNTHNAKIKKLEEDLNEIDMQETEFVSKMQAEESQEDVVLSEDQIAEYNKTKAEVGGKAAIHIQKQQQ
eukprot:TRINITY_DN6693_c0_g1_i1.p1 TRINITY_DN6693_c0_g1~~TRINITY_DN6693_c0_g1_i1.p1  ORF type:complete len:407 (+),score=109.10 TRINITY_DN6693_c0_g1_i1:149-1222(+)